MDSITGLIIQFAGIFLIGTLFIFLTNSLKSDALKYWKVAWLAMSCSLLSLYIAFNIQTYSTLFVIIYYLTEYVFAFMLIAGCRNYASGKKPSAASWLLLIPGLLVSLFFVFPFTDFNNVFNLHSFIMATSFVVAFLTLYAVQKSQRKNSGFRIIRFALLLLAVDFFHYTLIFSLIRLSWNLPLPVNYLAYNSIIDLVLEILLGFGMVIVLLERVRQDVEETNHKLKEAHDKLEKLAHVDPLTAAFTRHAFYGFLRKYGKEDDTISGCVGVFDIDNLKPINDLYGHKIGDVAISTVAHAIRSLVRADDLIFRWGGDEFFVVMLGFDVGQAQSRMHTLNALLEDIKLHGSNEKVTIRTSFGFADFNEISELEKAVEIADAEMYRAKQLTKKSGENDKPQLPLMQDPNSNIQAELF
jgi:diguanylate cyclase (GGDEF)-like protein